MLAVLLLGALAAQTPQEDCQKDVAFALDALEKKCGHFFELKKIDWKAVRKEMTTAAGPVKTEQEEYVLLTRLLARLRDGHARVEKGPQGSGQTWPDEAPFGGSRGDSGMGWCRVGGKIYVKQALGPAADASIAPGSEVLKVDGLPVAKWLTQREAEGRDVYSFSTAQQAFFWTTHFGLSGPEGGRMELELKEPDGKKKKRTLGFDRRSFRTAGPAAWPAKVSESGDLAWCQLPSGVGYVYLRRCKTELIEQMDEVLSHISVAPGLILDFRGNGGGGFDHDAFMGRFVPAGTELSFNKSYASAGPHPYGGPLVVIVDGTVISAAETGSGMFKEDGRGLMIGESATAGMSSSKETIELPSGKFSLYVSVNSNMNRFNNGKGIEGIGVPPHLVIEFDPADLAAGRDTLIRRAEELLAEAASGKGPWKDVPYRADK